MSCVTAQVEVDGQCGFSAREGEGWIPIMLDRRRGRAGGYLA